MWEKDRYVFKLSDEQTERVYWVHAIPTPWQAKLLLGERNGSPEEDLMGNPYELRQYDYAP